ncbi:MAG: hypothetical protein LEGION0398_MBIBDBAK_00815 [Legionellaceae bacterium]
MLSLKRHDGFSLFEILISLLISGIAILVLAKSKIIAFRYNRNTYYESVANVIGNSVLECLQLLKTAPFCEYDCNKTLAILLPKGHCLIKQKQLYYTIIISWKEPTLFYKKAFCRQYLSPEMNCLYFYLKGE